MNPPPAWIRSRGGNREADFGFEGFNAQIHVGGGHASCSRAKGFADRLVCCIKGNILIEGVCGLQKSKDQFGFAIHQHT